MPLPDLSRRERQIMDALFRLGSATAADVQEAIPDPPSYSAVRAQLRILEEKGHLRHEDDGQRYVYHPTVTPEKAGRNAMRHMLSTFFGDSPAEAVAALLDAAELTESDLLELSNLIDQARQEGR